MVANDDVWAESQLLQTMGGAIDRFGSPDAIVQFSSGDMRLGDIKIGPRIRYWLLSGSGVVNLPG